MGLTFIPNFFTSPATVHDIVTRGGRCLIPVFALGRAQELLLILGQPNQTRPVALSYRLLDILFINFIIDLDHVVFQMSTGQLTLSFTTYRCTMPHSWQRNAWQVSRWTYMIIVLKILIFRLI